jgi:hypothetical protein
MDLKLRKILRRNEGDLLSVHCTSEMIHVLPSIRQLYNGPRFFDILCRSEGGEEDLYLIFPVERFSRLVSQGIVYKKCPGRLYEGAEVERGRQGYRRNSGLFDGPCYQSDGLVAQRSGRDQKRQIDGELFQSPD